MKKIYLLFFFIFSPLWAAESQKLGIFKETKKKHKIKKNKNSYVIPSVGDPDFWGTRNPCMIDSDSQDTDTKYLCPLFRYLDSLIRSAFSCYWLERLTLLLAFPKELSYKEKAEHQEVLSFHFCLNYFLDCCAATSRPNTRYNLSKNAIQAIREISTESTGDPVVDDDFLPKFKKVLQALPVYPQIQQECRDIFIQLEQDAQQEPLKGYLKAFKEQRSITKLKQKRKQQQKTCNEEIQKTRMEQK